MITFIVCIFLLFILSSGAPVSGDFAFSLEDSIAAVRSSARSPRATLHERLQAIDAVRERFTGRMDAYYADIFQLLGGGLGDRSQSFVSEWHRVHRVSLAPKRNGVAAVSAIINDRLRLIMCTVPKIDSTTWRKTMLYLEHPELYANPKGGNRTIPPPDQHNIKKNGVKIMAQQSPATAIDYYNDPRYLKLFHCRNPVVRVLSAWISKNAQSSNPISFAADHATFKEFIMVIVSH